MIQAAWRSYHVRRVKLDVVATNIQRHERRYLVQRTMKMHFAAVAIQRHVIGMITRGKLKTLNAAAADMQRLARGGRGRRVARERHFWLTRAVLVVQRSA